MLIGLLFLLAFVVIQQVYDYRQIRSELEEEVSQKNVENEQMLIHIVRTLAGTIDAKDKYTKGHSSRVADYSKEIARRFGYSEPELTNIYMMGLLHDIGKIGIPDSVINKNGKLTDEEFELIKKHPVLGGGILRNIKEMPDLAWCARCHHEKYDGTGYPDGFKEEEIPEPARIVAVADHHIFQVAEIRLTDVLVAVADLLHCHRRQRQGAVKQRFQRRGHTVAIERIAPNQ